MKTLKDFLSGNDRTVLLYGNAGFHGKHSHLEEVYSGNYDQFSVPHDEQDRIHSNHSIPKNDHIVQYSGANSQKVNDSLVSNSDSLVDQINGMDDALSSAMTKHSFRTYSGLTTSPIGMSSASWVSDRIHKNIHFRRFTSTSTDFDVAHRFTLLDSNSDHHESDHHGIVLPNARHIVEFNVSPGMSHIASIRDQSINPHESEVLMGRGYTWMIHHRPTHIDGVHPTYVWKATPFSNFPSYKKLVLQ